MRDKRDKIYPLDIYERVANRQKLVGADKTTFIVSLFLMANFFLFIILHRVLRKEMFKLCPTVKTIVHTYNVPLRINVNNDVFKRQFHRAEDDYAKYNAVFNQLSQSEQATGHTGYTQDGRILQNIS